MIAVDGKTLRGSKTSPDGKGALHVVSAYATEAGLVLAQRAVDGKSNEITAIPELLDMLALEGAIVTIDAMGTQKGIARRIVDKGADYVLALKGNQTSLHEDAALFFADPVLRRRLRGERRERRRPRPGRGAAVASPPRPIGSPTAIRSGRACARSPPITARRIDKKTGRESLETRYYITSLEPSMPTPFSPQRAPIGASRTASTGRWT